MKLKKIISSISVGGIVLSSFNFSVLGSSSFYDIDNERYEVIQNSDFVVNNVLEESALTDLEIYGDTAVNLVDYSEIKTYNGCLVNSETKEILFPTNKSPDNENKTDMDMIIKKVLDSTKEYTVVFDVVENGMRGEQFFTVLDNWEELIPNEMYRLPHGKLGQIKKKFTVKKSNDGRFKMYLRNPHNQDDLGSVIIKNFMILEGDWENKKVPSYIESTMSVGENNQKNQLDISVSDNIFPYSNVTIEAKDKSSWYTVEGKVGMYGNDMKNITDTWVYVPSGYIKMNVDLDNCVLQLVTPEERLIPYAGRTYFEGGYLTVRLKNIDTSKPFGYSNLVLKHSENIIPDDFDMSYSTNKKSLELNEPLRGVSPELRDRIVRIKNKWYIERNLGETFLDGDEIYSIHYSQSDMIRFRLPLPQDAKHPENQSIIETDNVFISDKYPVINKTPDKFNDKKGVLSSGVTYYTGVYPNFPATYVNMDVSLLQTHDINGFKKWLSENPMKIIYRLAEPKYEEINNNLLLELFKGSNYISISSDVLPDIKVIIDRKLNKAIEDIEIAKTNPTPQNLSRARMWINLLEESSLKDDLQNEVNSIVGLVDLEIDKKTISSNIDLYIRSENVLSMSLSTNSVVFDNYSGVEDSEKLNAVELNIHSSLPYTLNSYLESPIKNSDGTATIEPNALNIKEQGVGDYQAFSALSDKIILNESVDAGNNNRHKIDLKLSKDKADKADVYKTTVKFEAVQK